MCVCMYVCVCIYVCVCMYVCMYVCIYAYVCMCVYVCIYVCMYVFVYVCVYVCVCMYLCLCMYVFDNLTQHSSWRKNECCCDFLLFFWKKNVANTFVLFTVALISTEIRKSLLSPRSTSGYTVLISLMLFS
jgi:hypothetical protein